MELEQQLLMLLSKWLEVEVYQNGNIYRQRFEYAYDKELKRDMPGTAVTKFRNSR